MFAASLALQGLTPLLEAPAGVEVTVRETEQRRLLFVLNHTPDTVRIPIPPTAQYWDHLGARVIAATLTLPPYGVAILEARA